MRYIVRFVDNLVVGYFLEATMYVVEVRIV